jgi:hypothetical protein
MWPWPQFLVCHGATRLPLYECMHGYGYVTAISWHVHVLFGAECSICCLLLGRGCVGVLVWLEQRMIFSCVCLHSCVCGVQHFLCVTWERLRWCVGVIGTDNDAFMYMYAFVCVCGVQHFFRLLLSTDVCLREASWRWCRMATTVMFHVCICVCMLSVLVYTCVCIHIHVYVCMYVCIYIYIYIYIYTHTHTHMYTHTHTNIHTHTPHTQSDVACVKVCQPWWWWKNKKQCFIDEVVFVCMHICMCVFVCVCVHACMPVGMCTLLQMVLPKPFISSKCMSYALNVYAYPRVYAHTHTHTHMHVLTFV